MPPASPNSASRPVPESVMRQVANDDSATFSDYRHLFRGGEPDELFESMTRALLAGLQERMRAG